MQSKLNAGGTVQRLRQLQQSANGSWANTEKRGAIQPVLQRIAARHRNITAPATAEEIAVVNDANTIDGLTNVAYANTMNRLQAATAAQNPVPLTQAMFPGVTLGHFTNMLNRLAGNNRTLKAAAVGYVIEDQVSQGVAGTASIASQVHVGGAIPDFVITHGAGLTRRRGIVDVTSSRETGHVFDKNFNTNRFNLVWESLYPTIDFSNLGTGPVTMAAPAAAAVRRARRRRANARFISLVFGRTYGIVGRVRMHQNGVIAMMPQGPQRTSMERRARLVLYVLNGRRARTTGQVDDRIRSYNHGLRRYLNGTPPLRTVRSLVQYIRTKYMLRGGPPW